MFYSGYLPVLFSALLESSELTCVIHVSPVPKRCKMSSGDLHHFAVSVGRKIAVGRDRPIVRRRMVRAVDCSAEERPIIIFDVLRIN